MRAALIALGIACGVVTAKAAVLVALGGGAQSLGSAVGLVSGGVEWSLPAKVTIAALVVPPVTDAWLATDNTLLQPLAPAGGGGGMVWAAGATVGVGLYDLKPGPTEEYFLVFGSGGSVGGPVVGVGGMFEVVAKTETFSIGASEPGSYALVLSLGLVAFAGYRRLRR